MILRASFIGILLCCFVASSSFSQHRFFAYWGYNGSAYSSSDIYLHGGDDYRLTLHNVAAKDVPLQGFKDLFSGFSPYNVRLGYYFRPKWSVSLGMDHMKYKTIVGQTVTVDGFVTAAASIPYQGTYNQSEQILTQDFFYAEHTDGLNYISVEVDYTAYEKDWQGGKFRLETQLGLGGGMLMPRTESYILGAGGNHPYHPSGYGMSVHVFPRFFLWKYAFVQPTAKYGYINMPRVYAKTAVNSREYMSQDFTFLQWNVVIGLALEI